MLTSTKYAGILLAGGKSSRYGSPKAFAKHQDMYFYEKVLSTLIPYVDDFVIVSNPSITDKLKLIYREHVIEDDLQFRGDGPLAGIYSGMKTLQANSFIVVPCDMPFLETSTIEWLIEQHQLADHIDGVIPEVNGHLQPLVNILNARALAVIEELLNKKQLKMRGLLEHLKIKIADATSLPKADLQFRNINTPDEYSRG